MGRLLGFLKCDLVCWFETFFTLQRFTFIEFIVTVHSEVNSELIRTCPLFWRISKFSYLHHMGACYITSVVSNFLWPYGLQPARLFCLWDSPGRNTGMGCRALLQGTSRPRDQTHVSLCLLHWQAGSLPLALAGKSFLHHSTGLFLFYFVLQIFYYATVAKIYKGIGLWTFT